MLLTFKLVQMDYYGFLAVCAAWINYIKTYLTEEQFRAILKEMADHFRNGTPFDGNAVEIGSFKRAMKCARSRAI